MSLNDFGLEVDIPKKNRFVLLKTTAHVLRDLELNITMDEFVDRTFDGRAEIKAKQAKHKLEEKYGKYIEEKKGEEK